MEYKVMKTFLVLGILFVMLFVSCEKKIEPVKVGELNDYRDPAYGFKIKYPVEWKQLGTAGKAVFVKSQEVLDKFLDPRSGEAGAQVSVEVIQYDGKKFNDIFSAAKEDMKQANYQLDANGTRTDDSMQLSGKPARMIAYSLKVTTKTSIFGHQIFV